MAIATIKFDEHNCPKRAKYRLVVLGNLDYHTWSKQDTAAPVLSQLELCLLKSLAIYNKKVLNKCDIKQAFLQSSLPALLFLLHIILATISFYSGIIIGSAPK
jgi:hypothetical protein